MKMPDLTEAQLLASLQWIASTAVGMGLCDQELSKLIVVIGSAVIGAAWVTADAVIRHGRNHARAAAIAAGYPDPAK